jgi:O-antigen ligase
VQDRDLATENDTDAEFAFWVGERLRRVALGATAALLTARAFWPSEPNANDNAGGSLLWVFILLIVTGVAVASSLIGGTLRVRSSWADLAFIALVAFVAQSASHAIDRRPAINLAWEWGAFAFAYLILRNLPRTRGESTALAGVLAATAVSVSVYGLYQVGVELPEVQRKFLANPAAVFRMLGIEPGTPSEALFRNRLLGSNEPFSTFGLANSLAGFLVGPLVVMLAVAWGNLTDPDGKPARLSALALAGFPILAVLVCLILTKSRSAYLGLVTAVLVLAWRERLRLSKRTLLVGMAAGLFVLFALAIGGLATGRLDRQVVTEAGRSLGFRRQYWVGTWRAITATPRSFWRGYGPGNFAAPYVLHKLPEASEEISDPHSLVLEVWATAGVWAVVALGCTVVLTLWNTLGPPASKTADPPDNEWESASRSPQHRDPSAPPEGPAWLVASASAGWLAVVFFRAQDMFQGDLFDRWLVLGAAWGAAVGAGWLLWKRRPLDSAVLGAAVLAVLVNLLAAGGISFPSVALALWTLAALGQNLRTDRPCGRLREFRGRIPAFGVAAVWVAFLGIFVGAATPYWKAEAAMADAEEALRTRPPALERAEAAYERAKDADIYSARPWLAMAALEYEIWSSRGAKPEDLRWKKIPIEMYKAVDAPRPPNAWTRHRERARMTSLLLKQIGPSLSPKEVARYRADVVEASRTATRLYPTNASLQAWLAEASAEIGMIGDAAKAGAEALRLHALTPHNDKKLDPKVKLWLESSLTGWKKTADQAQAVALPRPK